MNRRIGERLDRHPKDPAARLHLVGNLGGFHAVSTQNGGDRGFQRSAMDTLQFLCENLHHLPYPVSRRGREFGARDPRDKKKRTLLGGRTWSTQASGGTIYTGRAVHATEGMLGSTGERGAAAPR